MKNDPLGNIKTISQNLDDRYKDDWSIIKELMQNADDATAKTLHLGWLNKLPGQMIHPLLQGPAFFILNDGPFSKENAKAINYLSSSDKWSNKTAIGKFGLGLQSIFHWCEAFFCFKVEGQTKISLAHIINPWADYEDKDRFHDNWDNFATSDQENIHDYLQSLLKPKSAHHFCLWVPLRQQAHLQGKGAIQANYLGDDTNPLIALRELLKVELVKLLPLLHSLKQIVFWEDVKGKLSPIFTVKLDPKAKRRSFPDKLPPNESLNLYGNVEVQIATQPKRQIYRFSGYEILCKTQAIEDFQNSPHWPKSKYLDNQGNYQEITDKTEAHVAVLWVEYLGHEKQIAQLTTSVNVFLPVEEPKFKAIDLKAENNIQLCLHGYFFPDPGRTKVEGWDIDPNSNNKKLQEHWNAYLAQYVMFPLILRALDKFVDQAKLPPETITELSRALAGSTLYDKYQPYICHDNQWAFTVQAEKWQLLKSTDLVYAIPRPAKEFPQLPFEVIPGLKAMQYLTFPDLPRLVKVTTATSWETHLPDLLSKIKTNDVFSEKTQLAYLVDFLQENYAGRLDSVIDQLQAMARQALQNIPLSELKSHKSLLANFLKLIPPMNRVAFSFNAKNMTREEIDKITSDLLSLSFHHVLIPDDFEPTDMKSSGFLDNEEAVMLLDYVAKNVESVELRYQLVLSLFNKLIEPHQKEVVLQACGNFALFKGEDCQTNRPRSFSWNKLQQLAHVNTLFKYANPPNPKEFAPALFQTLKSMSIVLVDSEMSKMMESHNLTVCNSDACLKLLNRKPDLESAEQRTDLLQKLLQATNIRQLETQQALRYLLHGYKDKFTDLAPLLIEHQTEVDNIWAKLTHFMLNQRRAGWQLIDHTLTRHLTDDHKKYLKIDAINQHNTLTVLQNDKELWPQLHTLTFTSAERDTLLNQIGDNALLKRLPIHEDTQGNIMTLMDEHIYLQDFPISETLKQNIKFLLPHHNLSLQAKQGQLVKILTPKAAIELALEYSPIDYGVIMDALAQINLILPDLKETLQTKRWLPLKKGGFVFTGDVIYLPNLENEVARLVTELGGGFIEIGMLLPELRQHGAWPQLCRLFPPQNEALSMLGDMMADGDDYRVGELTDLSVEKFLVAFEGISNNLLPAYQVLKAVHDRISPEVCQKHLWPQIVKSIPTAKLKELLDWLMKQHQLGGISKNNTKEVHLAYLKAAMQDDNFSQVILPEIQLLNREGNWKPTHELCAPDMGFADLVSVDKEQYELLPKLSTPYMGEPLENKANPLYGSHKKPSNEDFNASVIKLDAYFQAWPKYVDSEVIGGFLSLLGNHEALKELSKKYLNSRHLETTRELLDWLEIEKTMDRWRFLIKITPVGKTTAMVTSLVGKPFMAPLKSEQELETLLVQSESLSKTFIHSYEQNVMYYRLEFREIQPQNFESRQLTELLKRTIQKIAAFFYLESQADFEGLFNSLDQSEQLDIEVTQLRLTDAAIFYLQQLRLSNAPIIGEILRKWEDLTYQHVEENQKTTLQPAKRRRNQEEIETQKYELRQLLMNDKQVQEILIGAVREKIEQSRYKPQSIPFELFQNADDALIELAELTGNNETINRCVMVWDEQKIQFIHWGRSINQTRSDLAGKNYKNDLKNMLILHFSGKTTTGETTGEFGLGFKTIFFITNHPKIVSGRLGFEIVGGVYPQVLANEITQSLKKQLIAFGGKAYNGTLFELPLEPGINAQEVMADFEKQINILLVFAKKIKQCDLSKPGKIKHVKWQGHDLLGFNTIQTGQLFSGDTVLLFNLTHSHLLFKLDAHQVVKLAEDIPTIWVTAPTQEKESLGFTVNGKFKLDMGRSQLAKNSADNWNLAKEIGREWGERLQQLFTQTEQQWARFCQETNLVKNNSPYDFWESFWRLLSQPELTDCNNETRSEVKKLLGEIIWGDGYGMNHLISHCAALPSYLWGDYQVLTRLDEVQYQATGALSKDEPTFLAVATWPKFRKGVPPKMIVSHEVGQVLSQVQPKQLIMINLRWVLNEEIDRTGNVDVITAQRLGALVTVEFMNELGKHHFLEYQDMWGEGSILPKTQFKAQDGKYHPAKELIITLDDGDSNPDEKLRSAFVPDKHVLSQDYQAESLLFFKVCRQRLSVKVETMVEWVFDITYDDKIRQKAVLDYFLSKHEQAMRLAEKLTESQPRFNLSWLHDLNNLTFFHQYGYHDQKFIESLLNLESPKTLPKPISDPKQKLTEIYEWWQFNKNQFIKRYERETYRDPFDDSNESWLTLFLLGSFHTIGWTNPQKNRNFLSTCYDKGWFNTFANDKAPAEDWIAILDNYLDEQLDREVTYLNWMRQFVGIYQISRGLSTYKTAFLESDKMLPDFSLDKITRLKDSWIFSGTDIVGPSMEKTIGIGACFIMRELVRLGILKSFNGYRHCYVPTKPVRDFFMDMGCEIDDKANVRHSIKIYNFVEEHLGEDKATFDNGFDLAILCYLDRQRGYW